MAAFPRHGAVVQMMRAVVTLAACVLLVGCGAERVWAPEAEVQRASYRHDGPPSITVLTVVSNGELRRGGHTALLINGSERVIFDPAGTWQHPHIPERNDVHFGMQDAAVQFYKDYHARVTWHVVSQEIPVSRAVADRALALVQQAGPVSPLFCTQSTTEVLRQLPGFEGVPGTFDPIRLMRHMDTLPGVRKDAFYDDSPANNKTIEAPSLLR